MQKPTLLNFTHFGIRLEERFGVTFTPLIRRELFELIRSGKARLLNTCEKQGVKEYTFRTVFRGMPMRFAVSSTGSFITCVRLPDKGKVYANN